MKKYDLEFKRNAVELADNSECPIKQTEKELGIFEGAIHQ